MDDLNDVTITSPTAGQVLSYNGTAWVNDTNGITGTGTTNYVPKFTSSSAIGNSIIYDDGDSPYQRVGIATTSLDSRFVVKGFDASVLNKTISAVDNANSPLFYVKNNGDLYIKGSIGVASTNPDIFSSGWTGSILGLTSSVGGSAIEINSASGNIVGLEMGITGTGRTFSILSSTTSTKFRQAQANPIIFEIQPFDEKMRLDASGNLLVATTSPSYNAAGRGNITIGGSSTSLLAFQTGGVAKGYVFHSGLYMSLWNEANGYIEFGTNNVERMRITSGGNVGIGTTNPQSRIHALLSGNAAAGPTGTVAVFQNSTTASNSYITLLGAFDSESGIVFTDESVAFRGKIGYNNSTEFMYFQTDGSERMRITSGGNVGIGTTSPQTQLDIANGLMFGTIDAFPSATYDAAAVIAKTGSLGSAPFNNAGSIVYRARVTSTAGRSSHIFYTGSPSTERMRLDESGNLGLGVTPSAWGATWRALELEYSSAGTAIASLYPAIMANTYNTGGGFFYKVTGQASYYQQITGQHRWFNAPSGTAGNAI
ncbi:MAG: hypothetical protein ACOVOV_07575, partial [Dolichospermum sp.]